MSQKLFFCFDGTGNEPDDSMEDRSLLSIEDSGITNVLKLHLLLGGDLKDGQHVPNQRSFYFSGIGTRGSRLKRLFDAAFAPPRLSLTEITEEALELVNTHYQDGDEVFLIGFSRGAAIARRVAGALPAGVPVRFMGVFDTVASIGKPNLDDDRDPSSTVVFENGTIAASVREALHLVAIDETRKVFRPTLMNKESRVTEIWLPGVHSDIGGGYREDGLSDSALQIMLEEFDKRSLGIVTLSARAVKFDELLPADATFEIDLDDIVIEPDHFSKLHEHKRTRRISKLTLATRQISVNSNDTPTTSPPLIHWTAAERIYGDRDYRPRGLRKLDHEVLMPDGTTESFTGLADHLDRGIRSLARLEVGEQRELFCNALRMDNHSGIGMLAGEDYVFSVHPDEQWTDLDIHCGASGWTRADIQKGFFKESAIASAELFRRAPGSNWFALMGAIGTSDSEVFEILNHTETPYRPTSSGEFCSFANDVRRFYSNNSGSIRFSVKRVG